MTHTLDIWKMLAGVAIFLLGIGFLEEALQSLSGRRFKLFLKKHTSSKWKAITGGAIVTALLQSSSVVSLMVLAFVGAGIIQMSGALAVIMGANLGTTTTGWLVALAGFNLNIESFALPLSGIAGIGYVLARNGTRLQHWFRFFLGLSFLFVGLSYIKTGMEGMVEQFDLARYAHTPLAVFLLIGFIISSLIQSSSATMAITLSALHAGAITLPDGVAIMLGAEVGTTVKLFMASVSGGAAKRRVAMGNFLFNLITTLLVILLLYPMLRFTQEVIGIGDPLIALVFFQSLVNVGGILLFYPFLGVFGHFLEKRFRDREGTALFLHKSLLSEPSVALQALEKENRHFLYAALDFSQKAFDLPVDKGIEESLPGQITGENHHSYYEKLKYLHGEMHRYYLVLQEGLRDKEEREKLDRLLSSVRNIMYAVKSIKDGLPDLEQLRNSSNDTKYAFYQQSREAVRDFSGKITHLLIDPAPDHFAELTALYHAITGTYTETLRELYRDSTSRKVSESEITTMLNFNREVYTAFKSFVFGVKDFLFTREQSTHFDELPGFIR